MLEVIGSGFGRTGTNSLKLALEQLGFGPCHHMYEIRDHPEQLALWESAAQGDEVDWDVVFAGYSSCVDWPAAHIGENFVPNTRKPKYFILYATKKNG